MARVFTTSFEYNKKTYTAIVTQTKDHVYIRIANDLLEELIPAEGLKLPSRRLITLSAAETEVDKLLSTILSALDINDSQVDVLPPSQLEKTI